MLIYELLIFSGTSKLLTAIYENQTN